MVDWLQRLFGRMRDRDGQAEALEPVALAADAAAATPAPAQHRRLAARPEAILLESLAGKVLHGWLGNRQQTLFPLALNLRNLDAPQRGLLAEAVAAAALAGGGVEPRDGTGVERRDQAAEQRRDRAAQSLARLGAGAAETERLAAALNQPRPVPELLAELQAAGLGSHAYAASLLAVDQREAADRAWLGYLAARFALPAEVVGSLNRRYRQ